MKLILYNYLELCLFDLFLREKLIHFFASERTREGSIAKRSTAGFSLLELVATIAIMAILMAISTLSFHSWQVKSNIEKQTRELFTDLSEARSNAFTQKKVFGIVFKPTGYVMKTYSSDVEYSSNAAAAANGVVVASKSLKYGLTMSGTNPDISNIHVVFDTSGFTNDKFTIFVNPVTEPAALNCVVISASRVNMGQINGANCEFR